MDLRRRIASLFGGSKRPIELDLVQQWVVLTLLRFGACDFARLQAEVEAIRGAKPAEMVMAIMNLEQENVVERLNGRRQSRLTGVFRLTSRGRRAGRHIPRPPRSPVTIYVR